MGQKRSTFEERIAQVEASNEKLQEQIKRLKKDKIYIESAARNELGMVRDGEIIFRFNRENNTKYQEDEKNKQHL